MESKHFWTSGHNMHGSARRNRVRTGAIAASFAILTGVYASPTRQFNPQFTPEERTQIVSFWSDPARFTVGQPSTATTRGVWQVRLTPEGSLWLWNLNKGKKSGATLAGQFDFSSIPAAWDDWIIKKIHHDRWQALNDARTANGCQLPAPDRETPEVEPPVPGTAPADLEQTLGKPPRFAQAVQPKQFTINFEDATVQYEDNVRMSAHYAYYRSCDGVTSGGVPLRKFDPEHLGRILDLAGCDASRSKVLKSVSQLEGGFDSVNTYDTGFVSVGFIQFASLKEGSGSLGSVLLLYKTTDPSGFGNDFHRYGIDVQTDGSLDAVDPTTGVETSGPDANAKIIQDKRLIAIFQRAGQKSDSFCAAQVKAALNQYYPCDDKVSFTTPDGAVFNGKVSDVIHSEAGMATLFDRKVNTGNIAALVRLCSQVAAAHHCQNFADLSKYEMEIVSGLKYRTDFTQDTNLSQPTGKHR
jgi:hypothetical protein